MVQKPPVDIEWYEDGFSMEEQDQLRKDYLKNKAANRLKIKVTEEYHEKTKDKIISELRQKLAANEEYIKELEETKVDSKLEETIKQLTDERDMWKKSYTTMNNKYAALLNDPELGVQKYRDNIKSLEKEVKELKEIRDTLLGKLCK